MEIEEERTNKHRKRKIIPFGNLTIGGEGGIAGLFMFGGALAFAGFMAVASFATKRNKAKRIHHHQPIPKQFLFDEDRCKSSEDNHDETTQSLIQHSTDQVGDATCCRISSPDSSFELLSESTQPLMEEKIDNKFSSEEESPTCFNHQEIAFSDYSNQESTTSSNENQVAQEEELKDEPQDGLTSTETEDDDDMKSDDVRETNEETEDDDDNDDDMMKSNDVRETNEEDSLKAIGTMYEEPILMMTVPKEATLNKNAKFSLMSNDDQPSILTTWVKPMLLLALLSFIVLLTHGLRELFYVFDDGDSVLAP